MKKLLLPITISILLAASFPFVMRAAALALDMPASTSSPVLILPRGETATSTPAQSTAASTTQRVMPAPAAAPIFADVLKPSADFAFAFTDQTFIVPAKTLSAWKGTSVLPAYNQFTKPAVSVRNLLSKSVGQAADMGGLTTTYHYKTAEVYGYLKSISDKINTTSTEPTLKIENGRVTDFTPPQTGRQLDLAQSTLDALASLERGQATSTLAIRGIPPRAALAQTNDLGISELIAQGTSDFRGSPRNRIHNIQIGVEKMKGVVIRRGEEFSFNEYLGPVDGEHGFLPELVIKKTGTVPEFGGGLCQVSSTAFRAAMAAGLPITERRNHAYAVQYYAPQGTDATIYPGVVDLKFVNDTPGAILVWPHFKDKNILVFDFYGTKDNRQVALDKPSQWDRKADGSMKASWSRVVIKDGEMSSSTFKSTYLPPALFHKEETLPGNGNVAGTSTPATTSQTNQASLPPH